LLETADLNRPRKTVRTTKTRMKRTVMKRTTRTRMKRTAMKRTTKMKMTKTNAKMMKRATKSTTTKCLDILSYPRFS